MSAPAPAPDSTRTSSPAAVSLPSASGTRATRRSPAAVSLATPTFMGTTLSVFDDGARFRPEGRGEGYRASRGRVGVRGLPFGIDGVVAPYLPLTSGRRR